MEEINWLEKLSVINYKIISSINRYLPKMKTIYCISGLGADQRAFANLRIAGAELVELPWLQPQKKESIEHYATRMIENIKDPEPVLLGLSFGGIMSIEIAKQLPVSAVILVSSIKNRNGLSRWMKMAATTRLNRILPMQSFRFLEPITNRTLGITNKEELEMVRWFRKNSPPRYTNWAVDKIINWQNNSLPASVFQIHGDKDRIFPIRKASPTYTIKGGGHLMIMNKAAEVSGCINTILRRIND